MTRSVRGKFPSAWPDGFVPLRVPLSQGGKVLAGRVHLERKVFL